MSYLGDARVFVSNLRSAVETGEQLLVEAVVLSQAPPTSVTLVHRNISGGAAAAAPWSSVPLRLGTAGRGVYTVYSAPAVVGGASTNAANRHVQPAHGNETVEAGENAVGWAQVGSSNWTDVFA